MERWIRCDYQLRQRIVMGVLHSDFDCAKVVLGNQRDDFRGVVVRHEEVSIGPVEDREHALMIQVAVSVQACSRLLAASCVWRIDEHRNVSTSFGEDCFEQLHSVCLAESDPINIVANGVQPSDEGIGVPMMPLPWKATSWRQDPAPTCSVQHKSEILLHYIEWNSRASSATESRVGFADSLLQLR